MRSALRARFRPTEDDELAEAREADPLPLIINPIPHDDKHPGHQAPLTHLFGDLFAAAVLLNLSNSTAKNPSHYPVASSVCIFALLWSAWERSMSYESRMNTSDAVHLLIKIVQCAALALIAGFSWAFDISSLGPPRLDQAGADSSHLFATAQELFSASSWSGLTVAFAVSRLVSFIQYGYAAIWAVRTGRHVLSLAIPAGFSLLTAAVFLGVHFDQSYASASSDALRWGLTLAGALILENIATLGTALLRDAPPRVESLHIERVSLLTLLLIGEGVNGVARAISLTVGGLGFSADLYGYVIIAILVIAMLFIVLFVGGQRKPASMRSFLGQVFTLMHFPLHVSILLAMEAIGGSLVCLGALNGLNRLNDEIDVIIRAPNLESVSATVNAFSLDATRLGISWAAEAPIYGAVLAHRNDSAAANATYLVETYRFFGTTLISLLDQYGISARPETRDSVTAFLNANATDTLIEGFQEIADEVLTVAFEPSLQLLPALAAVLLVSMILRCLQRRPTDAWAWLELVPRTMCGLWFAIGGALFDIGDAEIRQPPSPGPENDGPLVYSILGANWLLPMVAISLALLIVAEYSLSRIVRRQQRAQREEIELVPSRRRSGSVGGGEEDKEPPSSLVADVYGEAEGLTRRRASTAASSA